jgi:MYXO-CTERM domain-containing protein
MGDREYSVTLESRDASGNVTLATKVIRVPHDQGRTPPKCGKIEQARYVDDNDPRCEASVPAARASLPPPSQAGPGPIGSARPQAPAGCSLGGNGSQRSGLLGMSVLVLLASMRRVRRLVRKGAVGALLLMPIIASGCNTSQALDQCVIGWWRNPINGGCLCPPDPECSAADCVGIAFIGFLRDGSYYSGRVSWSDSAGTLSGVGSGGTFTAAQGSLHYVRGPGDEVNEGATCSGSSMMLSGTDRVRADDRLAATLSAATATGLRWKSFPISR